MVSALSSLLGNLIPLDKSIFGPVHSGGPPQADDGSNQPASNAAPDSQDRGPATEVSWSQKARDRLAAATEVDPAARLHVIEDAVRRKFELSQIDAQLYLLEQQDAAQPYFKARLKGLQAVLDRWINSPLSPEVTLDDKEAAKALQMLKEAGHALPALSGDMTYGFIKDGIQYNFRAGGKVTAHKEGVATSVEGQRRGAEDFRNQIQVASRDIRDNTAERADLIARREALNAQDALMAQ